MVEKLKVTDIYKEQSRITGHLHTSIQLRSYRMQFCILIFMWYYILGFAVIITDISQYEFSRLIILYSSSFTVFHKILGIRRVVLGPPQSLGEARIGAEAAEFRLLLCFSSRAAPHLTNLHTGLLHKVLLEEGFPSISSLKSITNKPSFI